MPPVPATGSATADPPPRPAAPARSGPLPALALLPLAAAAWWVGGFLWWLLASARRGDAGGETALPFAASSLSGLVLGGLAGGVAAGLLARLTDRRGRGLAAPAGGVALAVLVTLVQSSAAVREAAAGTFAADPVVLTGLTAVTVGAAAAGWGAGSLALLGRGGLAPALGVLAGLTPSWVSSVVFAVTGPEAAPAVGRAATWSGAALLALALVVAGLRPPARLLWWPPVVGLAWFAGPALTATAYLEPVLRPGAGLPGTLVDALSGAWQVFGLAAGPGARPMISGDVHDRGADPQPARRVPGGAAEHAPSPHGRRRRGAASGLHVATSAGRGGTPPADRGGRRASRPRPVPLAGRAADPGDAVPRLDRSPPGGRRLRDDDRSRPPRRRRRSRA